MITLFAAPIAGAVRSVEQFRTGVDEFLRGIENFNRTMENLNETAERMNTLLQEVEEPIRLAVPQVTRAVKNADEMMQVVSGPAMAAAPGLARLADTMSAPTFRQLPDQLAQFSEVLIDMSTRMAPLTQLAESAGGLFGMRMPGTPTASRQSPVAGTADEDVPHHIDTTMRKRPPAKASGSKKTAAKKSPAKKSGAKKSGAKSGRTGSTGRRSTAASKSERER